MLAHVAGPLLDAVRCFEADGFAPFHARYRPRDLLAGRAVRTTRPDLPEGIAGGITLRGELIVRGPDGIDHDVVSGEVSVRIDAHAATTPC